MILRSRVLRPRRRGARRGRITSDFLDDYAVVLTAIFRTGRARRQGRNWPRGVGSSGFPACFHVFARPNLRLPARGSALRAPLSTLCGCDAKTARLRSRRASRRKPDVLAPAVAFRIKPLQRPGCGPPLAGILRGIVEISQAADFTLDRGPTKFYGKRPVALRGAGDRIERAADMSGGHRPRAPDGENFADFAALGLVEQRLAAGARVLVEGDHRVSSQSLASACGAAAPRSREALYRIHASTYSAKSEPVAMRCG